MRISDWSSDVCSSDLHLAARARGEAAASAESRHPLTAIQGQAAEPTDCNGVAPQFGDGGVPAPSCGEPARPAGWLVRHSAIGGQGRQAAWGRVTIRSEEHTSELQSLMRISYAVFCLKKNKNRH